MSDDLAAALRAILVRLEAAGIPYMLVGSMAALAYGRNRNTQDFDVVVDADEARLLAFVRDLPPDLFYASEDAVRDAVRRGALFNVIDMTTGWKIDLVPRKRRPFSVREFERRRTITVLGLEVFVASIEDVILAKLEWSKASGGSARQIEDVSELVRIAGGRLDLAYVDGGAEELRIEAEWRALRPQG